MNQWIGNNRLLQIFQSLAVLQLINLVVLSPLYAVYMDRYAGGATEIYTGGDRAGFFLHMSYVIVDLVLGLFAYVGLFFLKPWARILLLISVALSWIEPIVTPDVYDYSNTEEMLSNISANIDGALIALAWATSVSTAFVRDAATRPGESARPG